MERTMDDVPLEELGDRLCELSAHIAAANYRWLRMLSSFDRRCGWAGWGMRSCAHWLNWKCGLDLRSAREKVRVARALDDLPLICEAFSRGEISYSKVRALTRIATPSSEADLLMYAKHGTTQHVEKIVRSDRRCLPVDGAIRRHERRHLEWQYEDGSVVMRARLDPEEAELVKEAISKIQEEVRRKRRAAAEAEDGSAEPPIDRADALVEMACRELAGDKAKGSSGARYTVFLHADADVLRGSDGSAHVEDGPAVSAGTIRRLTCDGSMIGLIEGCDGEVLSVGRKTRAIPSAIKRALVNRDGGCRFPGCDHKAFVDGHHIVHWADGGETSLENLVLLCGFHHRLLHEGKFSMYVDRDGSFSFLREDGRPIETVVLSVDVGGLEKRNCELGLKIDATTPLPRWAGEGCDYGVAVEGLLRRNGIDNRSRQDGSAEPHPAGGLIVKGNPARRGALGESHCRHSLTDPSMSRFSSGIWAACMRVSSIVCPSILRLPSPSSESRPLCCSSAVGPTACGPLARWHDSCRRVPRRLRVRLSECCPTSVRGTACSGPPFPRDTQASGISIGGAELRRTPTQRGLMVGPPS